MESFEALAGRSEPAQAIEQIPERTLRQPEYYIAGSVWTAETDEYLTERWGKVPARDIAAHVGATKNSVVGRARRLGLPRLQAPSVKGASRPRKKYKRKTSELKKLFDAIKAGQATELPPDQSDTAISLLDIQNYQCRWPLGEPAEMMFCGALKLDGSSYCARHHRVAYRKEFQISDLDRLRRHLHWKKVCAAKVFQFKSPEEAA